jgi:HEAT repeat protein
VTPEAQEELRTILDAREAEASDREALRPRLHEALWSSEPDLNRAALDVLGHWDEAYYDREPERVLARAIELTRASDAKVRAEACASLVLLRSEAPGPSEAALAALTASLSDSDAGVRQEAAAALGDAGRPDAITALRRLLTDDDPGVRFEAGFALASLGDAEARPTLESFLDHRLLRGTALDGLRRLGDPAALPRITKLRRSWTLGWADRVLAEAAALRLGDPSGEAGLLRLARRGRFEQRAYALVLLGEEKIGEAAGTMWAALETPVLRGAAVQALLKLGRPEDRHELEAMATASETDPELKEELLHALATPPPQP